MNNVGPELSNNKQVLTELNIAINGYIKAETVKAIQTMLVSVQANDRDPIDIKAAAKNEMETELACFR